MYKGPDRSMVALAVDDGSQATTNPNDEVTTYQDMRSFGSAEACWRLLNFSLFGTAPNVVRLPLHLTNQQFCQYPEGAERATVDAGPQTTPLTAWLEYVSTLWSRPACETATDGAAPDASPDAVRKAAKCPCEKCVALRTLYADMPTEHTYEKKQKRWRLRGRDTPGHTPIGRVYTLHPSAGEPFFLRTLLCCAIKGSDLALDFDSEENSTAEEREADQFTLEALPYDESGVKHESYQAACEAAAARRRRHLVHHARDGVPAGDAVADPRDVHVHRRPQRGVQPVGAAQQDGRRGGHADLAQDGRRL